MKTFSHLRHGIVAAMFLLGIHSSAWGQVEGVNGVTVKIWGSAYGKSIAGEPAEVAVDGSGFLEIDPVNHGGTTLHVDASRFGTTYNWYDTPKATVQMEPGKVYSLTVSGLFNTKHALNVFPAPGYQVEIDSAVRTRLEQTGNNHTYVVRVIPPMAAFAGRAGAASSLANGRLYW